MNIWGGGLSIGMKSWHVFAMNPLLGQHQQSVLLKFLFSLCPTQVSGAGIVPYIATALGLNLEQP